VAAGGFPTHAQGDRRSFSRQRTAFFQSGFSTLSRPSAIAGLTGEDLRLAGIGLLRKSLRGFQPRKSIQRSILVRMDVAGGDRHRAMPGTGGRTVLDRARTPTHSAHAHKARNCTKYSAKRGRGGVQLQIALSPIPTTAPLNRRHCVLKLPSLDHIIVVATPPAATSKLRRPWELALTRDGGACICSAQR